MGQKQMKKWLNIKHAKKEIINFVNYSLKEGAVINYPFSILRENFISKKELGLQNFYWLHNNVVIWDDNDSFISSAIDKTVEYLFYIDLEEKICVYCGFIYAACFSGKNIWPLEIQLGQYFNESNSDYELSKFMGIIKSLEFLSKISYENGYVGREE